MNARLPALLYHRVGPPRTGTYPSLNVLPERFESQLRYLVRWGFTGISASSWLATLVEAEPAPGRPILLTFDDGYADLANHAFPVLHHIGWGATVFVATSTVGGENSWDASGGSAARILSAEEVRTWASRGIEFGAHGATHSDLTSVRPERLHREVVGSRDALAELLGGPVTAFAYPYGRHDAEVRKVVASSFELAFGIDKGLNDAESDRTQLRRTMVQPGDAVLDLLFRTKLGWSPLESVRAHTRVRERLRRSRLSTIP